MILLKTGVMPMPDSEFENQTNKHNLSWLEKLAVFIIITLIIIILLLVFNKQIMDYIEIFISWYGSA